MLTVILFTLSKALKTLIKRIKVIGENKLFKLRLYEDLYWTLSLDEIRVKVMDGMIRKLII